ncbi:hypothetical protein DFJ77DRAFT_480527, partial [Powellomyces hirtus]
MDDILKLVVDELALEGSEGCSIEALWALLEGRLALTRTKEDDDSFGDDEDGATAEMATMMDEHMKGYLWPFIVMLKDVEFFVQTGAPKKPKQKAGKQKAQALPIEAIPKNELREKKLAQVMEEYGTSLHIAACKEARHAAVLSLYDLSWNLKDVMFSVLEKIGQSRAKGISQFKLAKILEVDPRSIFHYIKVLAANKL